RVMVIVAGEGELLEVVGALDAVGSLADLLHGGEEETDQHRDDGNDDEQFDEREAPPQPPTKIDPAHGHGPTPHEGRNADDGDFERRSLTVPQGGRHLALLYKRGRGPSRI